MMRFGLCLLALWGVRLTAWAQNEDWDRLASEDSCQRGLVSGCYNLGVDAFNSGDRVTALDQFQSACEKKFGLGCFQAAFIKETDPTAPDLPGAIELYRKAESLGNGEAASRREKLERKQKPKAPGVIF